MKRRCPTCGQEQEVKLRRDAIDFDHYVLIECPKNGSIMGKVIEVGDFTEIHEKAEKHCGQFYVAKTLEHLSSEGDC